MARFDGTFEYEEKEFADDDPAEEHVKEKIKRSRSRMRQRNRERRRYERLFVLGYKVGHKPSIWAKENEDGSGAPIPDGRVKRAKHSRTQGQLKKYGNHIVRRLLPGRLPRKGNFYRRCLDLWWIWI